MKLSLYILRELVQAFLFAVVGMFVIAMPVIAVAAVTKLQGVNTLGVLRFMPLLVAGLVPYVLPLSYLIAVVSTYGRLAVDNEWTALRMAGIRPLRMLIPGAFLAVICGLGTHWMLSQALPWIRRAEEGYKVRAIREQFKELKPGETEVQLDRFFLSSAWRDGDAFVDAIVYVPETGGQPARTIRARAVRFQFTEKEVFVFLQDARIVFGARDIANENPTFRLDLEQLVSDKESSYGSTRYQSSAQLARLVADPATTPQKRTAYVFEIHNRFALASTYGMFLLLGVPTGLLLRRGTQLGALSVAVGYALVYYLLSMRLSKELSTSQVIPPVVGAWLVVSVGALVGAYLLRRALRT